MKAVIGYVLAGVGILGLAINSTIGREMVGVLDGVGSGAILLPALVLLVAGLVIMILNGKKGGRIRQITGEVPIYQGEGKKRRIVGYRAD
jgi:hypothetical protein